MARWLKSVEMKSPEITDSMIETESRAVRDESPGRGVAGYLTDRRGLIQSLAGLAAVATVPGLTACTIHEHHYHTNPVYYYDYYYYPDVGVYYHIHTGFYFYFFDGSWRHARERPRHVVLDDRRRHSVVIREEVPYARHHDHRRQWGQPGNANWGSGSGPGPDRDYKDRPGRRGDGYEWQRQGDPQGQGGGQGQHQPQGQPQGGGQGQPRPQGQPQGGGQPQPQAQPQAQPKPEPKGDGNGKGNGKPECPPGVAKGKSGDCQ